MSLKSNIGFIGFGEIAFIYGKILKDHNCKVFVYDYRYSEKSEKANQKRKKAKEIGIEYVPSLEKLIENASYILSTVTPSSSSQIAKEISSIVTNEHTFLDLNSTNPKVKIENSKYFHRMDCQYLDGAIMGSPKTRGLEAPIYYSGKSDIEHSPLAILNIKKVGIEIGQASAIKICQSIITKGIQCLMWEQVLLAKKWNVQNEVSENLNELFGNRSYSDWCDYAITSNIVHSERRQQEMEMAVDFLKEMNLNAYQSEATCKTLNWISDKELKHALGSGLSSQEIVDFVSTNLNIERRN